MRLDYLLPLKASADSDVSELAAYLRGLRHDPAIGDVIVVDSSPPAVFARNAEAFGPAVRHAAPNAEFACLNGKVAGVRTGFALAAADAVVIADDDVRYRPAELARLAAALDDRDLVRPQNYFAPLPWHARWDSGRSLLNRAFGGDYPGTLAVRLTPQLRADGYDGDVLFETLELIRTVAAAGGRVRTCLDLFVRRLPPSTAHFGRQRVRQAYDSTAQPARLAAELTVAPLIAAATRWRPARRLAAAGLVAALAAAEFGRRRAGGRQYFPATSTCWVPLWLLERGVCSWLALTLRVSGRGVGYAGARLLRSAN